QMKNKVGLFVLAGVAIVGPALGQNGGGGNGQGNGLSGSGTAQHLTKFTGSYTGGNSGMVESGGNISTQERLNSGGLTSVTSGAQNFTIQGINNTTDGSTDNDAWLNSGIIGLLMQTQSPASVGVEVQSYATTGDPIGVFGKTVSTFRGVGVRGQALGGQGGGVGVLGETNSEDGFGVLAVNGASGHPTAMHGYVV